MIDFDKSINKHQKLTYVKHSKQNTSNHPTASKLSERYPIPTLNRGERQQKSLGHFRFTGATNTFPSHRASCWPNNKIVDFIKIFFDCCKQMFKCSMTTEPKLIIIVDS